MKRRKFLLSLAGTAAVGLTGWQLGSVIKGRPGLSGKLAKVSRSSWALGADVSLTVFHQDEGVAKEAIEAAFRGIEEVEGVMSLYRPESEISRLNREGILEQPHPWLVEVLETAQRLSEQTDGAFDITVQPLWTLYFTADQSNRKPEAEEIEATLSKVDWRRVQVDKSRIILAGEGTQITLNGIAHGSAADVVARILAEHGVENALIDTGEFSSLGTHAEKDNWTIGIKHPREQGRLMALAALNGRCLATSGDYETRFGDGYESHHLLDPHTGHSPTELSSVSIAASTALEADALSTAVFLLGLNKGRALVEATPGADAFFVTKDGRTVRTDGFPLSALA